MRASDVGSSINDVYPLPDHLQAAAVRTVCDRAQDPSEALSLLKMLDLDPTLARRRFRVK